jgi:hypothetical protein
MILEFHAAQVNYKRVSRIQHEEASISPSRLILVVDWPGARIGLEKEDEM